MTKIALIDHHLNNYHADTFLKLSRGALKNRGAQFVAAWESDPTGEDWCAKNDVPRAASIEDAVRAADAVMILAPDDIEEHLKLARAVLPFGKPTFIDKMLSTNLADAREIVALSKAHNAPIFSSSSLRYANEVEAALPQISGEIPAFFVHGYNDWNRYGIHTIAIALRFLGPKIRRVIDTGCENARTVTLDLGDERRAVLDVRHAANETEFFNWKFAARSGDSYVGAAITDVGAFYRNLLNRVLDFCESGVSDMEIEEAFAAVAILEGANKSREKGGVWVETETLD